MRKSLIAKLFLMIFVSFFIFIAGLIFALSIYFSLFYENTKINNTVDALNKFSQDYMDNKWSTEELTRQMDQFSTSNNVSMTILTDSEEDGEGDDGEHGEEKNVVLITVVNEQGTYVDFFLKKEIYDELGLATNSRITVEGYYGEDNIVVPTQIDNRAIEGVAATDKTPVFNQTVQITAIKDKLSLPSSEESDSEDYALIKSGNREGVIYEISEIPYTSGLKQVAYTKQVNGVQSLTFRVNSSLQPINESLEAIKSFYPILFIFALLLCVVIAFLYYLSVIKPIRSITKVADDMAKMDFTKKLVDTRQDELGDLSLSLNTLSNNLEEALNDLTVANEKLKEDFEKEVKQEQARKEFIANASHELKTPLGIIKGYAEGLKDGVNEEEKDDYIDVINDEIRIMDGLIQEMLRISKYDSMDIEINKKPTDMQLLIYDTIQGFEKQLSKKGLLLIIEGDFGTYSIDEEKVGGAFLNLFSNAIKYAKEDSTIRIAGTSIKEHLRIEISNDCEPFSEEDKEKVWERFYKRDLSHNTDVEGTGLGLSIVKSIFTAHDINYGVNNKETGVTFWFEV